MGIQGLLRVMKPYIKPVHVKKYAGKRVGIDAYSWLHKGAYSCSMEICQQGTNMNKSKLPYLQYCMHRINMLRYYDVIPVVVFDGGRLPSKASTEEERQRKRDVNLQQARAKLSEGDVNGAIELFQRAVEITPSMAYELIQVLKSEGVEFVVAPYEADAQLAYLARLDPNKGGIVAVISEDSDLMAYGCNVVIYKMDRSGDGEEVVLDRAFNSMTVPANELSFRCFTQELFTGMCVLAGCDFLPSVHGIGIKRAHALVSKYRNLDRVLSILQFDKHHCIPEGYANSFKEANAIFHYARVYDADTRSLSFIRPLPEGLLESFDGDDFLGPEIPPSRAIAIAEGVLDPVTMEAFDEFPKCSLSGAQMVHRDENISEQHLELQTEKEASPFVMFSQQTKDELWTGTEDKFLGELACERYKNRVNKEREFMVCELGAQTECLIPSQKAAELDRGFMAQLRAMAENSSMNASIVSADHGVSDHQIYNNGGVMDAKGQKRVFPPTPDNNPFKRKKVEDSSSLRQSSRIPSFQKAPDSVTTPLSIEVQECPSVGEAVAEIKPDDILPELLKSRNLNVSNKKHLAVPLINEQEAITSNSPPDDPDGTRPVQDRVLEFAVKPCSSRVHAQINATSVHSVPCPNQINSSSNIRAKTGTKDNKASSKIMPSKSSSGIMKFFTRI